MNVLGSLPMLRNHHGITGAILFDIKAQDGNPEVISDQLKALREKDLSTLSNLSFLIWPDAPIGDVFESLVETMECCSNKHYQFDKLIFHGYDVEDETHLAVLRGACHNPLFRMVFVNAKVDGPADEGTLHAIKDAMIINKYLKEIYLQLEVPTAGFCILGDGLKETTSLETLSIDVGYHAPSIALPLAFLEGIKDNRSLKCVGLGGLVEPAAIEAIIKTLVDHPSLEDLRLIRSCWGESSFAALTSLLSSPKCGISALDLSNPIFNTRPLLSENLANALKNNQSIQVISLRGFGVDDDMFARLYLETSSMDRLVSMDLGKNQIQSLPKAKKVARLKYLDLRDNPILSLEPNQAEESGILEFLQAHPQLKSLGTHFTNSICCTPKLQHLLDMNANGRSLFGSKVPPSVWARVLERGNKKLEETPTRQASVLYDLVRGISASL